MGAVAALVPSRLRRAPALRHEAPANHRLNPERRQLHLRQAVNAGHPPPLLKVGQTLSGDVYTDYN